MGCGGLNKSSSSIPFPTPSNRTQAPSRPRKVPDACFAAGLPALFWDCRSRPGPSTPILLDRLLNAPTASFNLGRFHLTPPIDRDRIGAPVRQAGRTKPPHTHTPSGDVYSHSTTTTYSHTHRELSRGGRSGPGWKPAGWDGRADVWVRPMCVLCEASSPIHARLTHNTNHGPTTHPGSWEQPRGTGRRRWS